MNRICILIIIFLSPLLSARTVGWDYIKTVTPSEHRADYPEIIHNEKITGIIYINHAAPTNTLYLTYTTNNGQTWTSPRFILQSASGRLYPVSAISRKNLVYVTYNDDDEKLYFIRSDDMGLTWSGKKMLVGDSSAYLPEIILDDDDTIHIFYHQELEGRFTLFHIESRNNGETWSKPELVIKNITVTEDKKNRGDFFPSVLAKKGNLFMVLQNRRGGGEERIDDELYMVLSSDNGKNWSVPRRLTNNQEDDVRPYLLFQDRLDGQTNEFDRLVLFYENNKNNNWTIYYQIGRILPGPEVDWEGPQKVTLSENNAHLPRAFIRERKVFFFWYEYTDHYNQIFHKILDLHTGEWSRKVQFTFSKAENRRQSCAVLDDNIYVAWQSEEKKKKSSAILVRSLDRSVNPPVLYSETHKEGVPSREREVVMKVGHLDDSSGIKGYATLVDQYPLSEPDIVSFESSNLIVQLPGLTDGEWFFHAKAIDQAGNMSETAHFRILIDRTGPVISSITAERIKENIPTLYRSDSFCFNADDESGIRGYSYILSNEPDQEPKKKILLATNVLELKELSIGQNYLSVMAQDEAGNWGISKRFGIIVQPDRTPPSRPEIRSRSHNEFEVSSNRLVEMIWSSRDFSGLKGFRYVLSMTTNDLLPQKVNTTATEVVLGPLANGTWYFRIKACDTSGNWSDENRFSFSIFRDEQGPVISGLHSLISLESFKKTNYTSFTGLSLTWSAQDENPIKGFYYILSEKTLKKIPDKADFIETNFISLQGYTRRKYWFYVQGVDDKGNIGEQAVMEIDLKIQRKKEGTVHKNFFIYRVRKGDTLSGIIIRILNLGSEGGYRKYLEALAGYNNIDDVDMIHIGEKIKFPVLDNPGNLDLDQLAEQYLGDPKLWRDVIYFEDKKKFLIRDPYFLRYGKLGELKE